MKNALARTVLALLCVCVLGWLVVGYRQTQLEQEGADAIAALRAHDLSPEQGQRGLQAARDAQWLNLDQEPRLMEGQLSLFQSRPAKALALAREVTDAEPDNEHAWLLAYLVESGDRKLEARRELRRLDPWISDSLD